MRFFIPSLDNISSPLIKTAAFLSMFQGALADHNGTCHDDHDMSNYTTQMTYNSVVGTAGFLIALGLAGYKVYECYAARQASYKTLA